MRRNPRIGALVTLTTSLVFAGLFAGPLVAAQKPTTVGPRLADRATMERVDADTLRSDFRRVLGLYPPELGRVLKLDPTLMSNESYLKSYPALDEFLGQHPDVARDPAYYLDFVDIGGSRPTDERDLDRDAMQLWGGTLAGLAILTGALMVALTITWLVRYIVSHRRWLRAMKVQADAHGRVLERLSTNDEIMAYIQSPVGAHFLKGVPTVPDAGTTIGAPIGRILWSAQAGLVLASAGIGLLVIKHYVIERVAEMLLVVGVLAIAIGCGFLIATVASYALSRRLGLFDSSAPSARSDGA